MSDVNSLAELLKSSSLGDILASALSRVKTNPEDIEQRKTLFKLYCIEGLWEKALMQLQTIELMDDHSQKDSELYKNLIFSELVRENVLAGERTAGLLDEASPEWMTLLQQANQAHAQKDEKLSEALRVQAFEIAPESAGGGEMTGAFSWIADGDGRIGPACEFISAGGYRQVPFSAIQTLNVPQPTRILDLIWAPAHINVNNEIYYGYVPARYPVSSEAEQNVKLGMITEWSQHSDIFSTGVGRKMLITDRGEFSLLEVTEIKFA
ncbi:ImpE family T6SS protein Cts1E [Erwinia tracheiphila]|uniref:ImpE family T6SS protein Cts1E n=1 Tax=Erwinia tracheiphila TaxID=65700 RepID=A0A345CVX4_9GAMM|nr:type VI secretion system accessory protein TagJ [Erwinia tracheiphila]AXF77591.1 ImpE family T6SS protein Cts1E [Erwinia tracheiphila]UIA83726.1 ImpE family T6SS protein Cts1E [Erwinia tracheiphila]UIA92308.1 ImpE family T6SS protein Cts1E [Erwinia tracheiphila]